jgi:hypothetical protein
MCGERSTDSEEGNVQIVVQIICFRKMRMADRRAEFSVLDGRRKSCVDKGRHPEETA